MTSINFTFWTFQAWGRIPFSEPRCFLQLFVIIDLFAQITSDLSVWCYTMLGGEARISHKHLWCLGRKLVSSIFMGKCNNILTSKFNRPQPKNHIHPFSCHIGCGVLGAASLYTHINIPGKYRTNYSTNLTTGCIIDSLIGISNLKTVWLGSFWFRRNPPRKTDRIFGAAPFVLIVFETPRQNS